MNHNTFRTFPKLLLIVSLLQYSFTNHKTTKLENSFTSKIQLAQVVTNPINNVLMVNLMDSIAYYHGKTVQTTGLFIHNECSRALYAAMPFERNGSLTLAIKSMAGLGMDFAPGEQIDACARENNKLLTLQGIIDTTGCERSLYRAILRNAKFVF